MIISIIKTGDISKNAAAPQSSANPDKLETPVRGLDHVRAVYREGHQSDNAGPRRGAPPWS